MVRDDELNILPSYETTENIYIADDIKNADTSDSGICNIHARVPWQSIVEARYDQEKYKAQEWSADVK